MKTGRICGGESGPSSHVQERSDMGKAEPTTFREKLAMFLMRQAYKWIEKIDRKAVPKITSLTMTIERNRGMVIWGNEILRPKCQWTWGQPPGTALCYITDYDYEKAHAEAVNK